MTAVATQGRSNANWMVTSYTLAYSVDGGSFTPYGEGDGQARNNFLLIFFHKSIIYIPINGISSHNDKLQLFIVVDFNCPVI